MPSAYSNPDLARIAEALRAPVEAVAEHASRFEEAAFWYQRFEANPLGKTPAALRKKAEQIRKAARRLLKHLGVDDPQEAPDGPGKAWIKDVLRYADGAREGGIVDATERVGRLAEIFDGICGAKELERWADDAEQQQVRSLADALGIEGHTGDQAFEMWLGWMMSVYRAITGERPRMQVGASGRPDEGVAGGRFIEFLKAAGGPLGIERSSDAWRSSARRVLDHSPPG